MSEMVEIERDLLVTIYAMLNGVVDEKRLHPERCGYISQAWRVKEEIREKLGHDVYD